MGENTEETGRKAGYHLWLIDQSRLTQETINEAVDHTNNALEWMIEDEIASSINTVGDIIPGRGITVKVTITMKDGTIIEKYINIWLNTGV